MCMPVLHPDETTIRLGVFTGVLVTMMLLEALFPRRPRSYPRLRRWPSNLGIVALDTMLVRLAFPVAAAGMAAIAAERGWGLFNQAGVPGWLAFALCFLLLDLAIWSQHVLFHKLPLLWRMHRMHHADLDLDVTSGLRFHPGEILLSMVIKLIIVVLLGAPVSAVIAFEIALNATAMWNHSNFRLPPFLDRLLRLFVVTPDMHRVHHSWRRAETDSNYGFNFPWWDRLFGTYRAQPVDGHDGMTIGLQYFRDPGELGIVKMLLQPFRRVSL